MIESASFRAICVRFATGVFLLAFFAACGRNDDDPGMAGFGDVRFFPPTTEDRRRAAELADNARLLAAADRIREWHDENGTGLSLNDAMSGSSALVATLEFGCDLPEELLALWRWRNGESSDVFTWYHRFLSLEDALAEYHALIRSPVYAWQPNWIPVFEFQEEWYFVECARTAVAGAPVSLYFSETGPLYAYVNLTTFLDTMATAMARGAVRWENGAWQQDEGMLKNIHDELNASGTFPYAVP